MIRLKTHTKILGIASALMLGGLSLAGCATEQYVDDHVAAVNSRVDTVDAKAQDAIQRADAAAGAARAAASAAQTAQGTAQGAADGVRSLSERLDQLTAMVQALGQKPTKTPRN